MSPLVYTVEEKRQIVKWYYQGNSANKIVDLFGAAYADRPVPNLTTVKATIKRFETLGCVVPCKQCFQFNEQQRNNCVMSYCAVSSCTSNARIEKKNSTGITFHSFPKDRKTRKIWITFVRAFVKGEKWEPSTTSKICSKHFMKEYFHKTSSAIRLKHNAIPTIGVSQDSQSTLSLKQKQDNPSIEEQEIEIEEYFSSNIIKEENEQICSEIKTEFVSIKQENDENLELDY